MSTKVFQVKNVGSYLDRSQYKEEMQVLTFNCTIELVYDFHFAHCSDVYLLLEVITNNSFLIYFLNTVIC